MFTNRTTVFTLGIAFTSLSVFAQEDIHDSEATPPFKHWAASSHRRHRIVFNTEPPTVLAFSPAIATTFRRGHEARATVYGAGSDFNASSHLCIRAEYRGLIHNSPTYDLAAFNGVDFTTLQAEPSIGLGWRF